jgi:uncharacterized membrane protein
VPDRPSRRRADLPILALIVALFGVGYSLVAVFRHWRFETSFDLAIFDQAVWHLSRFETPESTIRGFSNIFGDHFHPIIAVFAPLYWVAPAAETLLVAQSVLFAASIVPVFLFLRRRLPRSAALAFSVAYGLFWGLQRAVVSDVHEIAFAPLLIAVLIDAMDRRDWPMLTGASLLLAMVKEDLLPILAFAGLYLIGRGDRVKGAVLTGGSLVAFAVIVRLVIPTLSGSGQYGYAGSYGGVIARPWTALGALVTPPLKLETAILWLAPFCFLSLRSPFSVLMIPLALERFLSETPTHWGTSFHYSAPVAAIVAMSAGDGLARIAGRMRSILARQRLVRSVAAVCLLLCSLVPGHLHLWRLLSPSYFQIEPAERTGYRALALVPRDVSVVAQAAILPHLSQRKDAYLLDARALEAEFLVACERLSPWPAGGYAQLGTVVERRRTRGDSVVFSKDGWIVLRRQPTRLDTSNSSAK